MLELRGVKVYYDRNRVLNNIFLKVAAGDLVAVIGPGGAGKSALFMAISGILRTKSGLIRYQDSDITHFSPNEIVYRGISQVPEGRQLFLHLSVLDNLRLGAYIYLNRKFKPEIEERLDWIYQLFPILRRKAKKPAGTLSVVEQQMASMARALMSRPTLLLLDEPSRGLAPSDSREIYRGIRMMNDQGIAVLLAEQDGRWALPFVRYGYVLEKGSIVLEGSARDLLSAAKGT